MTTVKTILIAALCWISGGEEEIFDFTMGPNTIAYCSCSAKLNGEMFVFGGLGSTYYKQVLRIL